MAVTEEEEKEEAPTREELEQRLYLHLLDKAQGGEFDWCSFEQDSCFKFTLEGNTLKLQGRPVGSSKPIFFELVEYTHPEFYDLLTDSSLRRLWHACYQQTQGVREYAAPLNMKSKDKFLKGLGI